MTEAGEVEAAIAEWQKAAERASRSHADREAERYHRDALALLLALPESPERDDRELDFQLALGPVLGVTTGFAAAETKAVYARARSLSVRKTTEESLGVMSGLYIVALSRGDLRESLAVAEEMRQIASKIGNSRALMEARYLRGDTLHYLGDLTESNRCLQYVCENSDKVEWGKTFHDYGAYARAYRGLNDWLLGYPDQAWSLAEEAGNFARRRGVPFSVALVAAISAQNCGLRGDFGGAKAAAEEAEKLCTELGLQQLSPSNKVIARLASARLGKFDDAEKKIRAAIAEADAVGFFLIRQYFLSLLAETQALAGRIGDALETVNGALEDNTDSVWYRPLALTLRGDLRLGQQSGDVAQRELAEQDYRDAIELSRKMSAKSPELRASTSLARLLRDTGRRDEARAMLAEIYNWFSEGFDTADLKEAKTLLDEISN